MATRKYGLTSDIQRGRLTNIQGYSPKLARREGRPVATCIAAIFSSPKLVTTSEARVCKIIFYRTLVDWSIIFAARMAQDALRQQGAIAGTIAGWCCSCLDLSTAFNPTFDVCCTRQDFYPWGDVACCGFDCACCGLFEVRPLTIASGKTALWCEMLAHGARPFNGRGV
jgi:hypothetical protein